MTSIRTYELVLPLPPSVNHYLNYRTQRLSNGRTVVMASKTAESKAYEAEAIKLIKKFMKDNHWEMPHKHNYILVKSTTFLANAKSDSNNLWKLPLDCMEKAGLYLNDNKVLEGTKRVYIDSSNPRMEFEISLDESYGIFDSMEQQEEFIERYEPYYRGDFRNKSKIMEEAYNSKIHKEVKYRKLENGSYHFCIPKYDKLISKK